MNCLCFQSSLPLLCTELWPRQALDKRLVQNLRRQRSVQPPCRTSDRACHRPGRRAIERRTWLQLPLPLGRSPLAGDKHTWVCAPGHTTQPPGCYGGIPRGLSPLGVFLWSPEPFLFARKKKWFWYSAPRVGEPLTIQRNGNKMYHYNKETGGAPVRPDHRIKD